MRVLLMVACASVPMSVGCLIPLGLADGDGDVDAPSCELSAPCETFTQTSTQEGDTVRSVERVRGPYFDPATCPPAQVNTTKVRNDDLGRTVAYRIDSDTEDDGVLDYSARLERTYAGTEITSPIASETHWVDNDGDGVDDVRTHTDYPSPGDVNQVTTVYVDEGDDTVVDSITVYESMHVTDEASSTTTLTSTTRQDVDADYVDDIVSVTVRVDVDGETQSSTTTVTAADATLNLTETTTATHLVNMSIFDTETDRGSDGTVDARTRSSYSSADGTIETRYERDDDADGAWDWASWTRSESIDSTFFLFTSDTDTDGDGVPEQSQQYETYTSFDGMVQTEVAMFDDDGDGVFELIYRIEYDFSGEVVERVLSHETEGVVSRATYLSDFCFMFER